MARGAVRQVVVIGIMADLCCPEMLLNISLLGKIHDIILDPKPLYLRRGLLFCDLCCVV